MDSNSKRLLELLMFTVNRKAMDASERMNACNKILSEHEFHKGQYMAFSEVYTLLSHELKRMEG